MVGGGLIIIVKKKEEERESDGVDVVTVVLPTHRPHAICKVQDDTLRPHYETSQRKSLAMSTKL